ncbi:hypothetical protein LINPERPRIM_LOCUS38649, partial [Linum perenne]
VANRLWGYEGSVVISKLSDRFYLAEFNYVQLCEWVLGRSWHIHNICMIMRTWKKWIQTLDMYVKHVPEWITFKNVPHTMISVDGISWISSMIGTSLKKFVREGLDVRVCIIRDKAIPCPTSLTLILEDGGNIVIEVLQRKSERI